MRRKGLVHVKGYYTRAKVFGYMMIAVGIFSILYYLFQDYFN